MHTARVHFVVLLGFVLVVMYSDEGSETGLVHTASAHFVVL